MTKLKHALLLILLFSTYYAQAQVTGIGYTLAPTVEYMQWDKKAGLEDGVLVGGNFGIAFGEYLELRARYMQGMNLKTNFKDFGIANYVDSSFTAHDVDLTRWGGELKANLSRGHFLPFVTIGAGIQNISLDTFQQNEMIYVNYGAGIKLSASDRYTLTVEARNTSYNFNPTANLLTDGERTNYDISANDLGVLALKNNWAYGGSLQFYLGGRRPGKLSKLDKAYFQQFTGGFRGIRIPIEPSVGKITFNDNLNYRDTWLVGGYTGLDFSPYVGLRGFYFAGTKDDKISTDLDELAMYGGELRLKLSVGQGLSPYLMLGGGKIDVTDNYIPEDTLKTAKDQDFVMGGVGITLPLGNSFKLFGGARMLLTSGKNAENIQSKDEVKSSTMYTAGVRLIFGRKAKPTKILDEEINVKIQEQKAANEVEEAKLKQEYEQKVADLETKLNEAYAKKDVNAAADILKQKDEAEQVVAQINKNQQARKDAKTMKETQVLQTANISTPSNSKIQMSPAEFENLIEEILENTNKNNASTNNSSADTKALEARLLDIEKLLVKIDTRQEMGKDVQKLEGELAQSQSERAMMEYNARLLAELKKINDKIDSNQNEINAIKTGKPTQVEPGNTSEQPKTQKVDTLQSVTEGNVLGVKTSGSYLSQKGSSKLSYEGMSAFSGFNIGGQFTANVGFRWHYGIADSKFEFMPEAFFGFGKPSAFGLTGNAIYPFAVKNTAVTPYIGAGAGFMQIAKDGDQKVRLNYNIIFGSYLKVWQGRLYVDFTARNLFKYNQIIAGYRFSF